MRVVELTLSAFYKKKSCFSMLLQTENVLNKRKTVNKLDSIPRLIKMQF